jgi:hypothetical protein
VQEEVNKSNLDREELI